MRPPAVLLCALVLLGACGGGTGEKVSTVKVFAASSMTDVLPDIAERFEDQSAADVEFSFAGSSALREQILDGADADVFVSANVSVMQALLDAEMIDAEPLVVAGNTMTIAVPLGNPEQVTGLADFENSSLTLGVCAPGVPCGDLASTVFDSQGIEPKVDTNEANVRSLLTKVELGELDAALVYRTDVLSSGEVEEVVLPPAAAMLGAQYSAGAIAGSGPFADAFIEFLESAEAIEIFTDAGFVIS
jgi:molybdate transport system substrate-binding protein